MTLFNDGVGVVSGHAVMSEQGVQEGAEHVMARDSASGTLTTSGEIAECKVFFYFFIRNI